MDDHLFDALIPRILRPELVSACDLFQLHHVSDDVVELTARLPARFVAGHPWDGRPYAWSRRPLRRRFRLGPSLWVVQDTRLRTISLGGHALSLSPLQYDLLDCLFAHPGQVLSCDQLLAGVWGPTYVGSRQPLDRLLGRLRVDLPLVAARIQNVRGVGWRFVPFAPASNCEV